MTTKRANGASSVAQESATMAASMMQPAATSFLISQRMALEAARFWARRLHAYADQMETLAQCASPEQFADAQRRFIDRMREDYTTEGEALRSLMTPSRADDESKRPASGEAGAD